MKSRKGNLKCINLYNFQYLDLKLSEQDPKTNYFSFEYRSNI